MAVIADTKREAYVNTPFLYAGRKFRRGDVFPHVELKLTPFDLGGLVRVGYVRLSSPPSVAPAALPAATAQATEAARTVVLARVNEDDADLERLTAPTIVFESPTATAAEVAATIEQRELASTSRPVPRGERRGRSR